MEIKNTYNGGPGNNGPKTPEKDKLGNKDVERNQSDNNSGESLPQTGEDVVNEQEQNDIVNGQDGAGAEEFVNDAGNVNTRLANDSPLNNETEAKPGSGVLPHDGNEPDTTGYQEPIEKRHKPKTVAHG